MKARLLSLLSFVTGKGREATFAPADEMAGESCIPAKADVDASIPEKNIIGDREHLPMFKEILTLPGKAFELGDAERKQLAAVSCDGKIVVLVTPEAFNKADHLSLIDRITSLTDSMVHIETNLVKPSVLLMLHDKARGSEKRPKTVRRAGEVADTIARFNDIMAQAVKRNASDVHLIIKKDNNSGAVLFRIDGAINFIERYPFQDLIDAVGAAYTNLAEEGTRSESTFNVKAMQSCRIPLKVEGHSYNLRWQSAGIVGGMHVVIRVLHEESHTEEKRTLPDFGYAPSQCKLLDLAVRKTIGVIFVVGPAGAGKSTLLKLLMEYLPDRLKRISWAIEDPAEYKMYGVSQISLQRSITDDSNTNPFLPAMKMVLRADPDTILVGEVRDKESLSLLKLMVQSGHQVMSSLHAMKAISVVERLTSEEMGMSRQSLTARDFLSAIVYQQLVPLLCKCKLPAAYHLPQDMLLILIQKFGLDINTVYVKNPQGCECCNYKGTKGRTVVAEVVLPDHEYLRLVREDKDVEAEEYWRGTRIASFTEPDCTGKTALEHGLYKVSQGLVDPIDLENTIVPFEVHDVIPMKGE